MKTFILALAIVYCSVLPAGEPIQVHPILDQDGDYRGFLQYNPNLPTASDVFDKNGEYVGVVYSKYFGTFLFFEKEGNKGFLILDKKDLFEPRE